MKCSDRETEILLYYYYELDGTAHEEMERHLNGCSRCASVYAKLKTALDGIELKEPELPASFWPSYNEEVYRKIAERSSGQRWTLFGPRFIQVGAMALLLIFLGIGGMKLYETREERAFISENYALMSSMELLEEFDLMQNLDEIESFEG
ncbi:MAG: anti-sigma factor family protein [Thermodesulfobacteriota bacterium]